MVNGDNKGNNRRRLTPDEKERIVELRLNRVPVRTVAEILGVSTVTVGKVWKKHFEDRSSSRNDRLEVLLEETMARMEKNAGDARDGYLRSIEAGEEGEAIRFLEAERKSLTELSRLHSVLLSNRSADKGASVSSLKETLSSLVVEVEPVSVVYE